VSVEDDLLALETSGPVGRLGGRLDELRAAIALMAVTGDYSGLAELLAAFAVPGGIDAALADAAEEAARLGAADARQGIGAAGRTVARMSPPSGLAMQVIIGLAQARKLAATGPTTLAGSLAAVSPLTKAGLAAQRAQAYQVHLAANHARAAVLDKAGVGIMWVPERNACVHCTAYAGVSRNAKGQFPAGLTYGAKPLGVPPHGMATPPLHPNCLPGDAVVTAGSRITGATARVFKGELVRIETLGGKQLSGTANHPVLTGRGWVGLGFLLPGDHVVSRLGEERPILRDQHDQHVPALIGEVAHAAIRARQVSAREVPVSAVDFHGDGAGSDVAVVATDGLLLHDMEAALREHGHEQILDGGRADLLALARGCTLDHLGLGGGPAARRHMGRGAQRGALLGAGLRHTHGHALGSVALLDAALVESQGDDLATYAEARRDALHTLAGEVALDQVVHVERYAFHGEVFNLETEHGWYIGNGILTHNCRCHLEAQDDDVAAALKREADRSILRGFALESESERARLDAAERLLASGVRAPASVKRYAETAINRGGFDPSATRA